MNLEQQLLPSNIDIEFIKIDYYWHQGKTAFKDAQKSAKKIFTLLKLMNESFSNKYILRIMSNRLSHLNGMSDWKLKNLLGKDFNWIKEKRIIHQELVAVGVLKPKE